MKEVSREYFKEHAIEVAKMAELAPVAIVDANGVRVGVVSIPKKTLTFDEQELQESLTELKLVGKELLKQIDSLGHHDEFCQYGDTSCTCVVGKFRQLLLKDLK